MYLNIKSESELRPTMGDACKSFYHKAKVVETFENEIVLVSYETPVCKIANGQFVRLWPYYSATTMRHVNSFCRQYGIDGGGKAWWNGLKIGGMN